MLVPFLDLSKTTSRLSSVLPKWQGCLEQQQFVGGKLVEDLEKSIVKTLNVEHVIACANGTDAISIALQAAAVPTGALVAIPNLTFWATYEAVINAQCVPVLIDISPDDLQLNLEALKTAKEELDIKAVVLVHLFGWASAELWRIREYCKEASIILVEDGAQAFGVQAQNSLGIHEPLFSGAEVATLSFYPSKVLGGCMDGGAVVTTSDSIAQACKCLRDHGRAGHYAYQRVGWNSRMSGLQAAYLLEAISILPNLISERKHALQIYRNILGDNNNAFSLVCGPPNIQDNAYLAVIKLKRESGESIAKVLAENKIGSARIYPQTLDQQPPARDALRHGSLENSRAFCNHVINLPLFPGITDEQVELVCSVFTEVLNGKK